MSDDEEEKQSILVVEDDQVIRSAIVMVLAALGHDDVIDVGSGDHALKLLERDPNAFPTAIIDIFLTDMTAKHLARELPVDHGIQKLLILSSGTAEDFAAVRAVFVKRGIPEVQTCKKPVTREKLEQFLG